jgi:hypothetical protein
MSHMSVLGACWMQTQSGEKAIFGKKKHEGKKGQLEGKATHVREEHETCMQGRPNDVRVRFFAMYCNG